MQLHTDPWFVSIGSSVVVAVIVALWRRAVGKSSAGVQSPPSPITPQQIHSQLSEFPAYQTRQAAKAYRGLHVRWELEFHDFSALGWTLEFSAFFVPPWKRLVYASSRTLCGRIIRLPVSLARYPQFKVMKRGDEFVVEGTIACVDDSSIALKKCQFFFAAGESELHAGRPSTVTTPMHDDKPIQAPTSISQPTTLSGSADSTPTITPAAIQQHLQSLPPLQAEKAGQDYQGIEVRWTVRLADVFSVGDGTYSLIARTPGESYYSVVCSVDLARYPRLKVMPKDEQFTIQGTIVSADTSKVRLGSCQLFLQQ